MAAKPHPRSVPVLSTTCFRPVPDNVLRPSCRCLSGNRQLGVLDGAAAVDLVFDIVYSKTCSRHCSLSFVRLIGERWIHACHRTANLIR